MRGLSLNLVLFVSILFLNYGCNTKQSNNQNNDQIVAYLNSQPVYYRDVDKSVKQELYDELNRIYIIRKAALTETINGQIIALEAIKIGKTSEQLIEDHFRSNYSDSVLNAFIIRNDLESGVREMTRGINTYDIHSIQGKKILDKEIRRYLKQLLIDSLTKVNKISILLEPPVNPVIQTKDLRTYYRGNLESSVTFIEISDFECEACRSSAKLFSQLYEKYKDKVKFGFTNFSSYVSISALACESAAKQDKFWEFHDSIFNRPELPDTQDVFDMAQRFGLNLNSFKSDYYSKNLYDSIWSNIKLIEKYGIYGTPTILINNKLLFNSKSIDEIETLLLQEIEKSEQ